jgi:hypothetical protein
MNLASTSGFTMLNGRCGLRFQPVNATHYSLSNQRSVADEAKTSDLYYTESQRALMWERWQNQHIAQLFVLYCQHFDGSHNQPVRRVQ